MLGQGRESSSSPTPHTVRLCLLLPKILAWTISPHHPGDPGSRDMKHREGELPGQDPVDGERDSCAEGSMMWVGC